MPVTRTLAFAAVMFAAAFAPGRADEVPGRAPTFEERRMMSLRLETEGYAPCTQVSLVDGRWSCRSRNASGQDWQLSLSNLDFAVVGRQRLQ